MKRHWKWLAVTGALLVLGLLVGRAIVAKRSAPVGAPIQAQAIELAATDVARATQAELTRTLEISGGLKAYESAVVKARVAAEVKDITVREGDAVQAGQLLGHLDTTEYSFRLRQAEEQAMNARTQLDIAQRTLDNNKALVDQGFISKNALDTSVSSAAGAQASLRAANAAAELARKSVRDAEIRSPINGIVSQRLVQPGERVAMETKLLEIVDLSRLELEAAVAPEDVVAVRVGSSARLHVDGLAAPVAAKVVRINPSTQAGTRAVLVYLQVAPEPGLRQGLFARGTIELQRSNALVVPASAVRVDQARPYVLAVIDGKVVQRAVTLGQRGDASIDGVADSGVEVLQGLAAGERVLRGSVGLLRDGTAVQLAAPPP